MENTNVNAEVSEVIAMLDDKAHLKDVIAKLNELIAKTNEAKAAKPRDRGPESERDMTEEDARRISLGDMKDKSHKDAAKELGLSYGQIYSARKGFTFKAIYKEANAK